MTMQDDIPEMEVEPAKRRRSFNVSLVWLVPILAVLVSLGVAYKSYSDRGTLITITFDDAAGIAPKDTTVRFHDVVIGTVESVSFSDDLSRVLIGVRITKDVASTISDDAQFWVVRPEVSAKGISGLSTVLSGVYIDSAWIPTKDSTTTEFTGLSQTPMIRPGRKGTRVTINTKDGSILSAGAPVFYRGVEVGSIDVPQISENGESASYQAFINAPEDRFLTTSSRFWLTSSFSVKLGTAGLEVAIGSVSTLLTGGVAFDTVVSGGEPVADSSQSYQLFNDESSARESVFTASSENSVKMAIVFAESVSGLSAGAPVEYRGLRVGQVTGIGAFLEQTPSRKVVRLRATIAIDPQSLGLNSDTGKQEALDFIENLVSDGMRAQLAATSLFTSGLKIELADQSNPKPAGITRDADGVPVIPSVKSDLPDFTATAQGVLQRVNNLPIEEVMQQAISLMASIQTLASSQGTQAAPQAIVDLLNDVRGLVTRPSTQAIPDQLAGAIADLRSVVAELKAQGAITNLATTLDAASKAAENLSVASDDVPKLVEDLRSVAAKANNIKAEELVDAATRVLDSTDALVSSEGVKAIPPALSSALNEVRAALQELRQGGAVENTNATLLSARKAADAVAQAAQSFPAVSRQIDGLVARANALIASYGERSAFGSETLDLLRSLKKAAESVTKLAREIERNPNSLILGR